MQKMKYPPWISPFFGLMGAIFAIPALGGPEAVLALSISGEVALAAALAGGAGVAVAVALEWWSRRIAPPTSIEDAARRGRRRLAVLTVLGIVGLIALRTAGNSPSGVFRAVVFALFSGLMLGFAIVLPFDKRRRLPGDAPSSERRA